MPGALAFIAPPLNHSIEVHSDRTVEPPFLWLPTRPGVFVLESEEGATVGLAITANLRRLIRERLSPPPAGDRPSRRIDYRAVTRRVLAVTVGSMFEAEWIYVGLARTRLESAYRSLLDRWQAWFVHVDPEATFPRLVKTARPFTAPTGREGVHLGPMPDKHAAQRYLESLQNMFDLCRYHHILVEAPHAAACAYKELGRCPAPCDGSVSMDSYRQMIRDAVEFASTPFEPWRDQMSQAMQRASIALEFEKAERIRRRLDDAAPMSKPAFRYVDRLDRCRFVAVMPSEQPGHARVFVIRGGWIEPFVDVPADAERSGLDELTAMVNERVRQPFDEPAVDLLGLIGRHLFPGRRSRREGVWLPAGRGLDTPTLRRAIRRAAGTTLDEEMLSDVFLDVAPPPADA